MASQTLQWRINRVKAMLRKFSPTLELPDQAIQLMVHLSRNDVFRRYIPQRDYLARKTAAIADGTGLPADWLRYAENATYTTGGNTYPVEYIPVEKIPFVKNQPLFKASAQAPKLAIFNQAINLYPAGITANIDYYWRPTDLWNSAGTVALTTTDNMPLETEYSIVRGAVERCIAMATGIVAAAEIMEKTRAESEESAVKWYEEAFGFNMKNIQPLV